MEYALTAPIILFVITLLFVFAKAFQQRNVVFDKFWSIPIFSYIMAFCELAGVGVGVTDIIANGWGRIVVLGIAQGTGATLGCFAAMLLHKKIHKSEG